MSWISIDYEKCLNCGKCIYACSLRILKPVDEMAVSADETNCNLCGHCASICPEGAIIHKRMNMDNFVEITQPIRFDTEQFIHFIRQRRSHRHFRNKPIERSLLEKLADTIRYAPTGGNAQNVELIFVQDAQRIKKLSDLTVDYLIAGLPAQINQMNRLQADRKSEAQEISKLKWRINFTQGVLKSREIGLDPVFHSAPCVAIFHSTERTVTPKDNCVIAATTMGFLARTMGLESTFIAMFEHAAACAAPLRQALNLPADNRVYCALVIGYPRLEFRLEVDRQPIPTRWE